MPLVPRKANLTVAIEQVKHDQIQHLRRRAHKLGLELDLEQQVSNMLNGWLQATEQEIKAREDEKSAKQEAAKAQPKPAPQVSPTTVTHHQHPMKGGVLEQAK